MAKKPAANATTANKDTNATATTAPRINKAAEVRKYLKENPTAKPGEVVDAMAKLNIKVKSNYIATVRYHESNGKKKGKSGEVSKEQLKACYRTMKECGGIAKVQEALTVVEKFKVAGFELEQIPVAIAEVLSFEAFWNDTPTIVTPATTATATAVASAPSPAENTENTESAKEVSADDVAA